MTYLLDTNVCITFLRGRNIRVLEKFQSESVDELAVCATVRSELIYGALRSNNVDIEMAMVDRFLAPLFSFKLDDLVAERAAHLRTELAKAGSPIGPYDLQIAATALHHDLILVTHNVNEFGRVAGLKIEDWEA